MTTPPLNLPDNDTLKRWTHGQILVVPALSRSFVLTNDWENARSGDHPEAYRDGEAWLSRDTQYLPRLNFRVTEAIAAPAKTSAPGGFISGVYWHSAQEGVQVRRDGFRAFPPARRKHQPGEITEHGKLVIQTRHPRTLEAISRLAERLGTREQSLLLDALYSGLTHIASTRLDPARAEAFLKAFSVTQATDRATQEPDQDPFSIL
ncbi:hypothetical protein [Silvimonas amylolytica]|uniref:Uncharacterized protein n=1 Tax=Silvimonas amylolytica TaxID=449663 RepID=A0ABQ2PIN9_9NEIS|nr:hypothetical protein [Silvimonas amylolytica]GGP25241.1 hypothetical protein GCM10010971_10600 [Silvimonas amylolytica]